jgi:hypothetical protein
MSNRVAVIFDFDDTLAEDSTAALVNRFAEPPSEPNPEGKKAAQFFYDEAADLISMGWDPPLAYLTLLTDKVKLGKLPRITQKDLQDVGREHVAYKGVAQCLDELRLRFQAEPQIKKAKLALEFYIVSGGIGDLIRSTPITADGRFVEIWGCELDYDEAGVISRPKSVISFTEKTKYLFLINKGISREESSEAPYAVNNEYPAGDREIPFSHMFYVGDGPSDIPCISLLHNMTGRKDNTLIVYGENKVHKPWEIGANRGHTSPRDYENWAKSNIIEGVLRVGRRVADEILGKHKSYLSKDVGYGSKKKKKDR